MPGPQTSHPALTAQAFWNGGRFLMGTGLTVGLILVSYLLWQAPDLVIFFPLVLLGGIGAWLLFQHPLLNLCLVLASFVLIVDYAEGIQPTEVFYGLYYASFLGHWYISRLFLRGESILETPEEKALGLFLVLMTLSVGIGLIFGARPGAAISEWISLSMLAFYFPVKEACVRYRHGTWLMLGIVLWIGLFVGVRNIFNYQEIMLGATQAWQVAHGRVATNDILLMIPSLVTLALLVYSKRWWTRSALSILFLFFFAGLILTQSRGYWVAFAFGAFVLFLLVNFQYKKRLIFLGMMGGLGAVAVGLLLLDDYFLLVATGLVNRLVSLQSAITEDISLVNRFMETKAVFGWIKQNPILGYGLGGSYHYFDIIFQFTRDTTFVHNGYAGLWFKFGLWGLVLVLFFWLRTVWRGISAFRLSTVRQSHRPVALGATICLFAIMVSALTSNPFYQNDPPFIIALLTGLIGGIYARSRPDRHLP